VSVASAGPGKALHRGRRNGSRPEAGRYDAERDRALLAGIAAGDPAALEKLYVRHASAVYGLCLRVIGDRSEAEEVLEEVFFELWERSERFDPGRSTPLAYLITLARSRAIDRLRRVRRRTSLGEVETRRDAGEPAAPAGSPLADAQTSERRRLVAALLEALDPAEREALELSFFAGLSHGEIAARLDQPLGTVKTRIRRALLRLREGLEERGRAELP
jgi:RNA polymerase sigma-70 factor (ECF subfamily)